MTSPRAIASCLHVSKRFGYNGRNTAALDDVTLDMREGELVLLLGPSGSGKTTLLSIIAGLMRPDMGEVRLFERRIEDYTTRELQHVRARQIGFIFQNFHLLDPLTVRQNVEIVKTFCTRGDHESHQTVPELLRQLGIGHLADVYPSRTSQGEKQRAAIARALVNGATLVLADEPTASLGSSQGAAVIQILRDLAHDNNRCVVVASHDLRLTDCADRVVFLRDGMIEKVQ